VLLGIPYYPGAIERFIHRVAPNTVKRILLLCEKISSRELLESGYFDEVVEPAHFERRVNELAAHLAVMAPIAVQSIKSHHNRFERASAAEAVKASLASKDHVEGLAAWIEKRTANFKST